MDGVGIIGLFFLLISLLFFAVHIAICVWGYRDAKSRGCSNELGLLVMIALLFFPVIGLIVYLLIRNELTGRFRG
ncbi:hypothetical protein M3223_06280 [Paenibacillus pasadenensis]|uniref:hypothetical protein n=1 Tax=Paenibacillus pasadenensis TaxID=217090 RepID=UPI002040F0C2|nr:hypothetical protein [Paenibacillus pasadenensis]MCM3746960.1 hypothetical protein [Paenibacillus pasadenensis]